MTLLKVKPTANRQRSLGESGATSAAKWAANGAPSRGSRLDEVEAIARIGSYALDIPTGHWSSSKGLDTIFGIDEAFERSVEGWVSLVHPAEREAMLAYFADEVLGRARPFDRQYRIVRVDTGEDRWVHGRGALEFDPSGRPVRMFGTIADVTDERRTHEAVIASELRYSAIFEGTREAILIAELESKRFRWVNPAACALLGYTRGRLLTAPVRTGQSQRGLPLPYWSTTAGSPPHPPRGCQRCQPIRGREWPMNQIEL